jgi:hypothetical protein
MLKTRNRKRNVGLKKQKNFQKQKVKATEHPDKNKRLRSHLDKLGISWNEHWERKFLHKKDIIKGRKALRDAALNSFPVNHHGVIRQVFDQNVNGHYLSISVDDKEKCSFVPDPEIIHRWDDKRRRKISLFKYLRKNFPEMREVRESDLEMWCKMTMSKDGGIVILSGDEIPVAYKECRGGSSCMTGVERDYVGIYALNPEIISMLVYQDGNGTGRAILWNLGDVKLMDRIYSNSQHAQKRIESWARKNKYCLREHNKAIGENGVWFKDKKEHEVCLQHNGVFPYMDSFFFWKESTESTITLTHRPIGEAQYMNSCQGEHSGFAGCMHCGNRGHYIVLNNGRYCKDCATVTECPNCSRETYDRDLRDFNTHEGEEKACSDCFNRTRTCAACGKRHYRGKECGCKSKKKEESLKGSQGSKDSDPSKVVFKKHIYPEWVIEADNWKFAVDYQGYWVRGAR